VWGVKTKFALREIPICRRNGSFETLHHVGTVLPAFLGDASATRVFERVLVFLFDP
jgi:hypothetical protein